MSREEQEAEELSLKTFTVLTRAAQAVKKQAEEDIRQHGLNPTEFAVLELLYHKGEQPIQKIGGKVLIASSSITYVVDKLEKKAYLSRRPCPTDRRVTYASLTEEGTDLMNEIFPKHRQRMHDVLGGVTEDEKTSLIELMKKLGMHAGSL
ncbi:MarR family winged helix-turn-helix transcriptional regulator [Alkalicoccus urumqiensis]|uniref:MarR family transcriptional regulator n=1 Tax=Alkalicoccus urumqiensis TaxID=1548213 RepID=A0A2P6MIT3_ALKUR|nr:MarR family transcriptional regulator [Alkalicoccus urumqiensis]PRO66196.1 MarR family transcriptional regulator [Alkalicoccus urumqiensis]